MTDNLILWELQKIYEALTKSEENTLKFRMIKSTEKFNFSKPILKRTTLGLIRVSVHNSVFNVNLSINQFLYDTKGEAWSASRVLAVIPQYQDLEK